MSNQQPPPIAFPGHALVIGGPRAGEWYELKPDDWNHDEGKPSGEFKLLSAPKQLVVGGSVNGDGQVNHPHMPARLVGAGATNGILRYEWVMFGAQRLSDGQHVATWTLRFPEQLDPGAQLSQALAKLFFDGSITPPAKEPSHADEQ